MYTLAATVIAVSVVLVGVWFLIEKRKRTTHAMPQGYQPNLTFAHEQEFELYHNALSLCSMKTRLCMAELRIPYKSHHIDLIETGCYENIRPPLLTVNPGGTVPVLLHDGHPVYESHEQIRYAARFAPRHAPSLVPNDPRERAAMEKWIDLSSLTSDPLNNGHKSAGNAVPGQTLPLFATMIEEIPYSRIAEGFLFHFDKIRPLLFTILKLTGIDNIHRIPPAAKVIAKTRSQLATHLDAFEERLAESGGPWILGETYSLADVSWMVIFERLRQASAENVFWGDGKRPLTTAYWHRCQQRPAYTEAILGHSHPTIERGRKRIAQVKAANDSVRRCLEGS
ncbi:MAG: glutathione S-transferase [Hyphomicrobiaceae bacterium]|jgi:glutathione S-transferase